ncbi:steroid monooxygenase, partial [Aureobasidium pullulans]
LKKVADDYDLRKYIRLNHRIVSATWNEDTRDWLVQVEDLTTGHVFQDDCNVLINASGVLNKWKWPKIEGREHFQGSMLHTANWDDSVDLTGKRVAVIGGGSSAVQIVPNIQPIVKSMECFLRSTSWITGNVGQRFASKDGGNFNYSDEQKEILQNDPVKYLKYRKIIESEMNVRFKFILNGSPEQAAVRKLVEADMRNKLVSKPEISDVLIPKDFAVGCRRPTPGNGYLEALCKDNVEVVSDSITKITATGIETADGVNHEVDIIICATGFDVSCRPAYPTIGRHGKDLAKEWEHIPSTYLSITVPDFPNYLSTVDGEPMMWPGSRIHFFETMATVRWEDYHLTRLEKNRFAYLADGFASRESDGRDLSWYLGLLDGRDVQPEIKDEDVREFLMKDG